MNDDTQSNTPSFADAKPLGPEDNPFISELYALLERYGNTDRFGVVLLHDHFSVKEDEILLETNDPQARTLHLEVVKREDLSKGKFTSWRLRGAGKVVGLSFCGRACYM